MKKQSKNKLVKELAQQFEMDLNKTLPVAVRPDGSIVYKDYFIKSKKNGNWAIYSSKTRDEIDEFFLKSCALMAAKAYNNTSLERYFEIKRLDNRYWAHHCDSMIFKNNIKKAKDFDKYLVLLNRLEESELQASHYRDEISRMFKWSFV